MSDLIRRSDAIETAYQLRHKPNDAEWTEWLKSFDAIPSADQKTGEWIPVSEGLPEKDGEYLVVSGEFIYVYSYGIPLMPMNERNRRWGWYESTSEGDFYMDVDAWMPLPEPYKGGDDE